MRNALIAGERVYLRTLEVSDAEAWAELIATEPDTFQKRGRLPLSPIALGKWIEKLSTSRLPTDVSFAVCLKEDGRLIGNVDVDHIDWVNRTGETGSYIADATFRGQGYGTEAKFLLLEYFFERLHFHALCSYVFETNTRSAAALAKQGYRPAGRWKWDDLKDGVYRDVLVFDILREEYLAAKEIWLAARNERR
ncbi:MAG: GNAT family N-acetyltransferase [Thermomicrobiales bacterium]